MNDPKWIVHEVQDASLSTIAPGSLPTVGVGGYSCNRCGKGHITLAVAAAKGFQIDSLMQPDTAVAIVKDIVAKLADIGESYLALNALRALTLVNEIATMTDTEVDFLNGGELREQCRQMLKGKCTTFPRMYDSNDEQRAIEALRQAAVAPYKPSVLSGTVLDNRDNLRWAVRAVAEALGMKPAFG
jgi:hypothetical protein